MAEPFVAEIRVFPFNFAPKGWALCNGQLLPLSQNTALFSLLGTTYGGDGKSNFALPDLQGRVPMHPGQGPGLSLHDLGEEGGSEAIVLLPSEMPAHGHRLRAAGDEANLQSATPTRVVGASVGPLGFGSTPPATVPMADRALTAAGGSQPHTNLQPSLVLHYCIALQGVFPPRG